MCAVAACGFGVDLDGLFADGAGEGGPPLEGGGEDGGEGGAEGGIPSIEVQQLALGFSFGCGRRIDGTVMCWGQDDGAGQIGDGLKRSTSAPVLVKDVADAIDVAVGQRHACVIRKSGTAACWGDNEGRQLGDGTTTAAPTPREVVQLTDAKQLALGYAFSCALKNDGTVQCWGDNAKGQLGDGTLTPRSQPAPVTGISAATQIVAMDRTACALVSGEVLCWGYNGEGEVGSPPPTDAKVPIKVAGLTGVASLGATADANHVCAVTTAGEVRCWGAGGNGQLGNSKEQDSATPVVAISVNDAVSVTTGGSYTCATRKSGSVSCWGYNGWRQLGLGDSTATTDNVSTPLPVNALAGVKTVAAGRAHTCALLADGKHVSCWGSNLGHGLGRGTLVSSDVPVKVTTPGTTVRLALGEQHACAVDSQGAFTCWGNNELRQQSVTTYLATGTATPIPGIAGVTRASAGNYFTCALSGGQIKCWGNAGSGQLGNGATPYIEPTPQVFAAGSTATDVGGGSNFTCALLANTDVVCSGSNDGLRLGGAGPGTSTPVRVPTAIDPDAGAEAGAPPLGATKLTVSPGHSCVLRAGGVVTCWGYNSGGECGVPNSNSTLPADVPLPSPATAVAAGGGHTCAVLQDGSVRCWGYNNHGQTTGGLPDSNMLRAVDLGGKKATAVTGGDDHSCALLEDGTVSCWGKGTSGQLGNGVRADATTPVAVKNLAKATAIEARSNRTCAIVADGSAFCWGNNRSGELGDGAVMTTGSPAPLVGY
ncbi:MAG: regulator of chromosome condensation [Labilithrix sp.]|nr:regulator of chromosome condensation [Labilithrix sp.]